MEILQRKLLEPSERSCFGDEKEFKNLSLHQIFQQDGFARGEMGEENRMTPLS